MATTLDQQVALDEALVPSAQRLRIGRSNFRLPSDIQSKEPTLQVEFCATAKLRQHSICFKMDTRKYVLDLEAFREMLHISPRSLGQSFAELPFEEEILEFLRFLGHNVERTEAEQLNIVLKWSRQEMHISQQRGFGTDEGTGCRPGVSDVPSDDSEEELSSNSSDDEDVDEQTKGREESEGDKTDESNDDDDEEETTKISEQEVAESDEATESDRENNEDNDNNEEDQGLRIGEEERMQEEEDAEELYFDVDINQGRGLQVSQETEDTHVILTPTQSDAQQESSLTSSFMTNLLNPITDPGLESLFTTGSTTVTLIPSPQSTMTPSIISTFTSASQLPTPPTQIPSLDLQSLPTFASVFRFEDRVKSLEDNFSNIPGIVNQYMNQQMPKAVREAMQTQTNQLQDSIQRENDEFLKTIDENMKKIIKEQVKTQVKGQVTRILPRIEEAMNAQLEAEVLTRSSQSSRTSYRSDEQQNLYKELVKAYDADKTILDIYGESTILKRRREDDDQEGPSAGSDRGSKRRRKEGEHLSASESAFAEEPVQTTCQMEEPSHLVFETGADDQPIIQTTQHPEWFSQPRRPPTPNRDWNKYVPAALRDAQSWISTLAKQTDARSSFNELLDTPIDFSNFIMNRLGRRIIAVTELKIMEWHNYKHFDWISVRRDDDKIYKFKECDLKRLRIQDIEDMLLLLVQGKLSNLTVEERFAFNVSLRMFTRRIVIQRRVEDLQLGVKSYQKRLNLIRPDTYRSDLKRREAYTANGTLNDVHNVLDDHLKGIRMQYLPTT
nr:hypothetical protein [Tanacetum cinerariifolium]